jgi:hypothetical protein
VFTPAVRTRDRHRCDHSDRNADRTRVRWREHPSRSCTLWIDAGTRPIDPRSPR